MVRLTVLLAPMFLLSKVPVTVAVIVSPASKPVNVMPLVFKLASVVPSYILSLAVIPDTVIVLFVISKVSGLRVIS